MTVFDLTGGLRLLRSLCFLLLVALGLLSWATPAQGWWAPLHMTTAEIASRHLSDEARKWIKLILENDDVKGLRFDPSAHDFVSASHWADEEKLRGVRAFDDWHHTNLPIVRDRGQLPPDFEPQPLQGQNILWALEQAQRTLKDDKASTWGRSLMLRLMIHFAGDMHMPVHAVNFYSKDFPAGDLSGNHFPVTDPTNPEIQNLHAFWDWGAGVFPTFSESGVPESEYNLLLERLAASRSRSSGDESSHAAVQHRQPPPSGASYAIPSHSLVQQVANQITKEYPWKSAFPPALRDSTNFTTWLHESFQIANESVYSADLVPGEPVTEEYREVAQGIIRRRVALGGYRLAAVMNQIFPKGRAEGPETERETYDLRLHEIILYVGFGLSFLVNLGLGYACLKRREKPTYLLNSQEWS